MYRKVSITLASLPTALPETMMGSDYELCMSMYELNLAQNRKIDYTVIHVSTMCEEM